MIDLHCHVDLYPDPVRVVRGCHGVNSFVLSVTTTPSAYHGTRSLAAQEPCIHTALGLHPQLAAQRYRELHLFDELLKDASWVGEVGLDGTPEYKSSWDQQMTVFRHVLHSCTEAGGRPLSIHSRGAAAPVIQLLKEFQNCGTPVLHWFSGTKRQLQAAIEIGCWFSVGLPMLVSQKGRQLVEAIPRDRLLTETDGPFVQYNDRPSHPWDVGQAISELAILWSKTNDEVLDELQCNLGTLLKSSRC